ncbi:MAG: DUF6513 domain-containing protein [Gammaproteobacteria bacterium]
MKPEHLLFLTGKLAHKSLQQVLEQLQPTKFTYDIHALGVSVAALMTADMIKRRLEDIRGADRVIVPGRCRGDIEDLSRYLGIPVERGPEELKDLPAYFGKEPYRPDLSRHDVQIFAEIVEAPELSVAAIVARAGRYRQDGANVIDLGCLPDTPFPHLTQAVQALKREGFTVSVDSTETDDLLTAGRAGADYLLSLKEETLWVADEVSAVPILIPDTPQEIESLYRATEKLQASGKRFIADSILDPIHFGFTESIVRYHALRARYPDAEIMMGIGNLTELTHADTAGINAVVLGIISELHITHLLTTEVSPHCRTAVREADRARRIMYRAREDNALPRLLDEGLLAVHERKPFPYALDEIKETATQIKDPNYRIQVTDEGIHVYNRDGLHSAQDPFGLYPTLAVDGDDAHAFYLGVELARAQIAWQLGKRYSQDEELGWGVAVEQKQEDMSKFTEQGATLRKRRRPASRKTPPARKTL